jgi:hypothetical protein
MTKYLLTNRLGRCKLANSAFNIDDLGKMFVLPVVMESVSPGELLIGYFSAFPRKLDSQLQHEFLILFMSS